jgi:hypothetical protein
MPSVIGYSLLKKRAGQEKYFPPDRDEESFNKVLAFVLNMVPRYSCQT